MREIRGRHYHPGFGFDEGLSCCQSGYYEECENNADVRGELATGVMDAKGVEICEGDVVGRHGQQLGIYYRGEPSNGKCVGVVTWIGTLCGFYVSVHDRAVQGLDEWQGAYRLYNWQTTLMSLYTTTHWNGNDQRWTVIGNIHEGIVGDLQTGYDWRKPQLQTKELPAERRERHLAQSNNLSDLTAYHHFG